MCNLLEEELIILPTIWPFGLIFVIDQRLICELSQEKYLLRHFSPNIYEFFIFIYLFIFKETNKHTHKEERK